MAEYINREALLQKAWDADTRVGYVQVVDVGDILDMPSAKVVSLYDIFRVIAGHSYYHGDRILAALKCIVEGKEVNPVCPTDLIPVVRCKNCKYLANATVNSNGFLICHVTGMEITPEDFCSYAEEDN